MRSSGPLVPRDFLIAGAAGLLWGLLSWWGDDSSLTFVRALVNTAGPWLLIAFAMGARAKEALPGALLGAAALLAAIVGYYVSIELFDAERAPDRVSFRAGWAWATAALPVGAFFGLAGAAWRAGFLAPIALGVLGGALFGEGLLLLNDHGAADLDYLVVPVAAIATAFALPVLLTDRREAAWAIVVVAALGPVALLAERTLLETVRGVIG